MFVLFLKNTCRTFTKYKIIVKSDGYKQQTTHYSKTHHLPLIKIVVYRFLSKTWSHPQDLRTWKNLIFNATGEAYLCFFVICVFSKYPKNIFGHILLGPDNIQTVTKFVSMLHWQQINVWKNTILIHKIIRSD